MKKGELKKLLKPLIKECIKEVIFEEGVLAGVVTEVARGLRAAPLVETVKAPSIAKEEAGHFKKLRQTSLTEQKVKMASAKKELLDAIGRDAYNGIDLFEGTKPLSGPAPTPGASPSPQGALSGIEPGDAGVDIGQLFGNVGSHWKAHMDSGK